MLIRVDDYPGTKKEEFDKHNLKNFKKFDKIFKERDLTYVLGVIPGHCTKKRHRVVKR